MAQQQPPAVDYDALAAEVSGMAVSHGRPEATPIATGGGRGTGLDVRKSGDFVRNNAPAIGALTAVAAGPPGIIASPLLAGAGAFGGAMLRGDDAGPAIVEGIKQTGLQAGGQALVGGGRMLAHGLMKGTVPKNIAKKYQGDVDIPKEMLERGAFPGVKPSANRVERLSKAANAERDAAAETVPVMPRSKVIAGIRPVHEKGATGKVTAMTDDARDFMRESAREIGPEGLTGKQALARKDIKQTQADPALNASNSRFSASTPDLANAERGAIVAHLRETPRMATALNESQSLMAMDEVMKDAALSNPVTRARIGGLTAASLSPVGLGGSAHLLNQGSRAFNPQLVRLLDLLMGAGSHEQ